MIQEWGGVGSRKGLDTVQGLLRNRKNISIINTDFSTDPKHVSRPATMKKIYSIQAKTSTKWHQKIGLRRGLEPWLILSK